jgi:hypothetical protein
LVAHSIDAFRGTVDLTGAIEVRGHFHLESGAQVDAFGDHVKIGPGGRHGSPASGAQLTFATGQTETIEDLRLTAGHGTQNAQVGSDDTLVLEAPTLTHGMLTGSGTIEIQGDVVPDRLRLTGPTVENHATMGLGTQANDAKMVTLKAGTLRNESSGTLVLENQYTEIRGDAPAGVTPALVNHGTLVKRGAGEAFVTDLHFENTGTVRVEQGELDFKVTGESTGEFIANEPARMSVRNATGKTVTFAEDATIRGAGDVVFSTLDVDMHGTYDVGGETLISGSNVAFSSSADVQSAGSRLVVLDTLSFNTGDQIQLQDLKVEGVLSGSDTLTVEGDLTGDGQINTDVVTDGETNPGASPGTLKVGGSYAQGPNSELIIEIMSPDLAEDLGYEQHHDQLIVEDEADFAGTLRLALLEGFQPEEGATFPVFDLADGQAAGRFDSMALPSLSGDLTWDTSALYRKGVVKVVPEPGAGTLLLGGLLLCGVRTRRFQPSTRR